MKRTIRISALGLAMMAGVGALLFTIGIEPGLAAKFNLPNNFPFLNASGLSATVSDQGEIDLGNPFFKSLGSNGRSCVSCHEPDQGWAVSPAGVKARFALTAGTHPIFRTNDGSNCNHDIDVSSVAGRRKAYSLLLDRGLIRVGMPVPANAEFEIVSVANQYGCNETSTVSMYRRPLPTTNLRFLTTVMWDGRESTAPTTIGITPTTPTALDFDLNDQAVGATNGHAQALAPLGPEQKRAIVDFEMSLHTAQVYDFDAGWLHANGAQGGPRKLADENFFVSINDRSNVGVPITLDVFSLFTSWSGLKGKGGVPAARASIARGEVLFNSKTFNVSDVAGLNDVLGRPVILDTCSGCHNTPNVGNRSIDRPLDIGVSNAFNPLDISYLPTITVRNKVTGTTVSTTDPGRAMVTGKWADMNKVKLPVLRGLASRPPYFHNGSAATLSDTVEFYNQRFQIGLTPQEKADLTAFLSSL